AHLRSAGFAVIALQPLQTKAYARLHLRRAKNDAIDAALIAACTAALDPPTWNRMPASMPLPTSSPYRADRRGRRAPEDPSRAHPRQAAAPHRDAADRALGGAAGRRAATHCQSPAAPPRPGPSPGTRAQRAGDWRADRHRDRAAYARTRPDRPRGC